MTVSVTSPTPFSERASCCLQCVRVLRFESGHCLCTPKCRDRYEGACDHSNKNAIRFNESTGFMKPEPGSPKQPDALDAASRPEPGLVISGTCVARRGVDGASPVMLFSELRRDLLHVREPVVEHRRELPRLGKEDLDFAIIRGVLAIIFGLIAFFAPIATAIALAIVIGVFAIVTGVFDIIEAIASRDVLDGAPHRAGRVSILFGILVLVWPGISLAIFVILVGVWAIVTGVLQVMSSVRHRAVPTAGGSGASSAAR